MDSVFSWYFPSIPDWRGLQLGIANRHRQTEKPAVTGHKPRKGEAHRDSAVTPLRSGAEGPGMSKDRVGDLRTVQGTDHPQPWHSSSQSLNHTVWPKEVPSAPSCGSRRHPVGTGAERRHHKGLLQNHRPEPTQRT